MGTEFEFDADAKVLSCTTQSPEKVLVLVIRGFDNAAVRQDDSARNEIVNNQAVFDCEPAIAATKCETTDASIRDSAANRCKAIGCESFVNITPYRTSTNFDGLSLNIDLSGSHVRI